jgi:hypothetical protein
MREGRPKKAPAAEQSGYQLTSVTTGPRKSGVTLVLFNSANS